MTSKAPLLNVDAQRSTNSNMLKVGIALIGGSGLVLLCVVALSTSGPAVESTSLFGMPSSLRSVKPRPVLPKTMHDLPGSGVFKELTIAALEDDGNQCSRDVSMKALKTGNRVKKVMASLSPEDKELVAKAESLTVSRAESLLKAGVVPPFGFFDPQGFTQDVSDGRILFFREAEIKHGRVCMLAFVGMLVGENYHPVFGGNYDIPAAGHFGLNPAAFGTPPIFWAFAWVQFMFAAFWEERRTSWPTLEGKAFTGIIPNDSEEVFAAKSGRIPGDLGFDPLGLKPKKEAELLTIQNKEILNGRLAMISVLGILAQELATGKAILKFS